MSEENKNMDDSFRKMSEEFQASYDRSYWKEVERQMDDESMDNAFREAAANVAPLSGLGLASEELGDAFMDDAFREAAAHQQAVYSDTYWNELQAQEANLLMDDAFFAASKEVKANYNPDFWSDANVALEKEGLHYEYQSAYWDEAKVLLDQADRRSFFAKWSGAAAVLLLISFLGINYGSDLPFQAFFKPALENEVVDLHEHNVQLNNAERVLNEANLAESNSNQALLNTESNEANVAQQSIEENSMIDAATTSTQLATATIAQGEEWTGQVENTTQDIAEAGANVEVNNGDHLVELPSTHHIATNLVNVNQTSLPEIAVNSGAEDISSGNETENLNLNRVNTAVEMINFTPAQPLLGEMTQVNIDKVKRRPVHQIAVLAQAGTGSNYSHEEWSVAPRYALGLEYISNGFGKLRKFELGGNLGVNHVKQNIDFTSGNNGGSSGEPIAPQGTRKTDDTRIFYEDGTTDLFWLNVVYTDMYYANANLMVNYKFNTRNKLKFGFGAEYLMAVKTNMAHMVNRGEGIQTVNNNWGVRNGILPVDLRFSLGYEYRLNNLVALQVNANYGLFDRTDNNFFTVRKQPSSFFDNEMNVMLGVKYNLFRKID